MEKIRIKNLRSLQDTNEIELKPLTVLVGKNSSGKSTFLRFFPLMKQTLETRTNEPILWYSSRYVDFGSFKESLNHKRRGEPICFEFGFRLPNDYVEMERLKPHRYIYAIRLQKARIDGHPQKFLNFKIKIEFTEKVIEKMQIDFEDHTINIEFKGKEKVTNLRINDREYEAGSFTVMYQRGSANILPQISWKEENNPQFIEEYFHERLLEILKRLAHYSTSQNTIRQVIEKISLGSSDSILNSLKEQNTTAQILLDKLRQIQIEDDLFQDIKDNLIGMYLNRIIAMCNRYFEVNFSSVKYIAPLRASAERYYRIQGLSVDEVDPQGANIPMILHNMNPRDRQFFNQWLKENFDFQITTSLEGGHTSLKIKQGNNQEEINLADTGFGYSQVLPIILVLWQAITIKSTKRKLNTSRFIFREFLEDSVLTLVIEQPELHLHPALQAKLMDTFAQLVVMAQENEIHIRIIIETHSETMLNRLGYLIAKKKFQKDLVNILIFNKVDSYESQVESTSYSERGTLTNWPIGFFSPEDF